MSCATTTGQNLTTHRVGMVKWLSMKLINSTDYSDSFLRKMVAWVCVEIGLKPRWVRQLRFTNSHYSSTRGRASHRKALIRIGDANQFPSSEWRYGGQTCAVEKDRDMGLVSITTHELFHLVQAQDGVRGLLPGKFKRSNIEGPCVVMANRVAAKFDENRAALMAEWMDAPKAAPKTIAVDFQSAPELEVVSIAAKTPPTRSTFLLVSKRAHKTEADLAKWIKRLKTAQNKVRKLTRKAKYYTTKLKATRQLNPQPKGVTK